MAIASRLRRRASNAHSKCVNAAVASLGATCACKALSSATSDSSANLSIRSFVMVTPRIVAPPVAQLRSVATMLFNCGSSCFQRHAPWARALNWGTSRSDRRALDGGRRNGRPGVGCADDGAVVDGQAPTVTATPSTVCGNNVVEAGEDCDDGNTLDCDTCPSNCRTAAHHRIRSRRLQRWRGGWPTSARHRASLSSPIGGSCRINGFGIRSSRLPTMAVA